MRIACAIALWVVALDCAQKAVGVYPQTLFAEDALWLWWLASIGNGAIGIRVLLWGAP